MGQSLKPASPDRVRHRRHRPPVHVRVLLTGTFLALFLALLALLPGPGIDVAAAQTGSPISVEGNRRIEADTIRSYIHLGPDGELDARATDAALKALYATSLFRDVRIKRSGSHIVVVVVENPLIDKVAFEGNKGLKDKQLTDEIQSKPRSTFSPAKVQSDVQRIIELYRHSGRYDARVDPQTIERNDNRLDLVFRITEGDKTGVKKIAFVGNHAYGDQKLKDAIRTREWNWLSWLTSNDVYDPDRIEVDRDLLRRFYLKNGYADIRVVSAVTEYNPQLKGFAITFTLAEGDRYRIGKVDVQSDVPSVAAEPLRGLVRTTSGGFYDADAVQRTIDDMTREIAKRGYPFAVVQPRGERDLAHQTMDLVYRIQDGPRIYVERINIRGNNKTRDYVIRRELDIGEGDAYNRALIDRGERRLKNLNFFESVKIANEPGSASDKVVVNIDVVEKQTGDLYFSGGYSTVEGPLGEVTVGERNLWGTGVMVKSTLTLGEYTRGFDLAFTQPYFLGERIALGVDVFGKETLVSTVQSYGSETFGGTLRLGAPLTEETSVALRYSIFNQRLTLDPALMDCSPSNPPPGCYANGEASLPIKQAVANGPAWVSMVGYSVGYNSLDNNQNPTSGVRSALNQDFAGLGGDVKFVKTTSDIRYYQPITNDVVGIARVQDGYVTGWGGQQVPLLNSFFGGPQFVRGFEVNGFGPRDLTPGTTMDNIGGNSYWATSAELQSPIPYVPTDFGLKVALFADAGNVWGYGGPKSFSGQSIMLPSSSLIRSSVGAGLIWSSPLGPLRVDYARPITKATYDVVQPFRFSAGPF